MSSGLTSSMALSIIQRMGETGQPPERGALHVNVGTDEALHVLRDEYLQPIREGGRNSSFKLVQAPFGGGKTQFLYCLREIAWQERFVTAVVGVSPDECPFDDTERIYQAVARKIEAPPKSLDEEPDPGIDVVLRAEIERRMAEHDEALLREWLRDEFGHARVDSHSVRRAALLLMQSVMDGNDEIEEIMGSYLRGEPVKGRELAPYRVRETLEAKTAFQFLRSLIQVLRALDVPGVVLLFDELDRVMSLTVRRRKAIGDNLRQMIDHCGQAVLPALLWVYAVPPEFMTTVVPEYPALEQRLRGAGRFSPASPLAPIIDLDNLPLGATDMLTQIGLKLLELYELGHNSGLERGIQRENVHGLARELGETQLETGTRRTFVKAIVELLGRQHREGERRLTEQEIAAFVHRAGQDAPPPMDDEEQIS